MEKSIGILTSGGDTPGLNAAIRGLGKASESKFKCHLIGFKDGFRGLLENRFIRLNNEALSGILTIGGTILGTSRDKPHKMPTSGKFIDMTDVIVENYHKHHLDCLVCLGGGGTVKNAYKLMKKGLNVICLPKTIDNDVAMTDITFGFDTALGVGVEAIDRLHSTASSHHRIMVVQIMGHKAGWLALGAGISGGADVILIPEIPYKISNIANAILNRSKKGKTFSIVAVAEGALSIELYEKIKMITNELDKTKEKNIRSKLKNELNLILKQNTNNTIEIAKQLEELTKLETRVTILGHLQRGGTPSAADRLLATRFGTACAEFIDKGNYNIMVAVKGTETIGVPLEKVSGKIKFVPPNHPWIKSARYLGTCLGD